ncbi:MAG: IS1 family transposase [Gemmatimonadales bacterium]|nr:IS1 family transposase [Gemmatimonadales bacterium]
MSVRATCRLTGASKGAVLRFLHEAGSFVQVYQHHVLRNLSTVRVEADEIWSFVGAKQRNARHEGQGDCWTFCALDADSKLVFSWLVGARSEDNTHAFIADVAARLTGRVQLSTDGWGAYLGGIRKAFAFARVDYGQIAKSYGQPEGMEPAVTRRYSPPVCTGVVKRRVIGRPNMATVSTSYVEALNLATRQHCRRFTRLTIAHSKTAQNHAHAVALHFFAHNFLRVHTTLRRARKAPTTPAMAAGVTDHVWTVEETLDLMDPNTVTVK